MQELLLKHLPAQQQLHGWSTQVVLVPCLPGGLVLGGMQRCAATTVAAASQAQLQLP